MCALAYQEHCGAASCFATWLFVSAPDDAGRGVSESLRGGEGGRGEGDWRSVQKNPPKNMHARTRSACGCTSGVSSQSADNPPDTTNSTDLHNRAASLTDYSNPSEFYLSNSLSSLRRREAGNKTSGLKGSLPALPHSLLLIAPPLSPFQPPTSHPPTPAARLISLIFNLTWTVINGSSNEGREEHKGYFAGALTRSLSLPLIRWALSAVPLSSIFNDFFISALRRRFVCAFM